MVKKIDTYYVPLFYIIKFYSKYQEGYRIWVSFIILPIDKTNKVV